MFPYVRCDPPPHFSILLDLSRPPEHCSCWCGSPSVKIPLLFVIAFFSSRHCPALAFFFFIAKPFSQTRNGARFIGSLFPVSLVTRFKAPAVQTRSDGEVSGLSLSLSLLLYIYVFFPQISTLAFTVGAWNPSEVKLPPSLFLPPQISGEGVESFPGVLSRRPNSSRLIFFWISVRCDRN